MARALDLAVTPWGVIAGGVLTGKYCKKNRQDAATHRYEENSTSRRLSDKSLAIGDEVVRIAAELGCTPAQVALNWVRQQPGVIIPIIGVRTEEQVRQNLAALDHPLPEEHLRRLSEISAIELGFPHDFLMQEHIANLVYAHCKDRINNHREAGRSPQS